MVFGCNTRRETRFIAAFWQVSSITNPMYVHCTLYIPQFSDITCLSRYQEAPFYAGVNTDANGIWFSGLFGCKPKKVFIIQNSR